MVGEMNALFTRCLVALLLCSACGCTSNFNPNKPADPIPAGEGARVEQEQKAATSQSDPGGATTGAPAGTSDPGGATSGAPR
jgi:hypothetical protein